MTMRYDGKRTDVVGMLQQNMLHLLPVYWLAMLCVVPFDYVPVWYNSDMSHLEIIILAISNFTFLDGFLGAAGFVMPCTGGGFYGIALGPTYYLRGQLLFTLLFNPIQT